MRVETDSHSSHSSRGLKFNHEKIKAISRSLKIYQGFIVLSSSLECTISIPGCNVQAVFDEVRKVPGMAEVAGADRDFSTGIILWGSPLEIRFPNKYLKFEINEKRRRIK